MASTSNLTTTTTTTTTKGTHILVFPFPAHGHMLPLLDLTHQLALRNDLTITILITPKNLSLLQPLLTKHPSIRTLILPFPTGTTIPSGIENMKDLPISYFSDMISAMSQLHNPLIDWFKSHPPPSSPPSSSPSPVAILSDIFLGWTQELALQLSIHRIAFYPSSAYSASLVRYFLNHLPNREYCKESPFNPITASGFPGSPTLPIIHIFGFIQLYAEENPLWESIRVNSVRNRASWGIVINSFTELEEPFLSYLKEEYGHDRVWGVGPILKMDDDPTSLLAATQRGAPGSAGVGKVMSWLDSVPDRSVVYICFGTQIVQTSQQIQAIAKSIEKSGVHFIWCIKEFSSLDGDDGLVSAILSDFEDRTDKRGLVMREWVPQVAILRHRSVSAYLTHCGWNSTLEGLVAGVQLLMWPMGADHFMNAKFFGDESVGLGVKVCEGKETIPDSTELSRALAESVRLGEVETRPRMIRAMEIRKLALEAVKEGGSSFKSLDEMVEKLGELSL